MHHRGHPPPRGAVDRLAAVARRPGRRRQGLGAVQRLGRVVHRAGGQRGHLRADPGADGAPPPVARGQRQRAGGAADRRSSWPRVGCSATGSPGWTRRTRPPSRPRSTPWSRATTSPTSSTHPHHTSADRHHDPGEHDDDHHTPARPADQHAAGRQPDGDTHRGRADARGSPDRGEHHHRPGHQGRRRGHDPHHKGHHPTGRGGHPRTRPLQLRPRRPPRPAGWSRSGPG